MSRGTCHVALSKRGLMSRTVVMRLELTGRADYEVRRIAGGHAQSDMDVQP